MKKRAVLGTQVRVPLRNKKDLSIYYTPGVADVCRQIVAKKDDSFRLTMRGNSVAVVTDGSAVLGLGNIGPLAAMPVMEGKSILFKRFGGVDAFPICLDTQDTEEIIKAVKIIAPTFGGINLEDISAPRCFVIEERLKRELNIPVFHDDQHGTAIVVLAGMINAMKVVKKKVDEVKVVINGAGAAGIAVAKLLYLYGFKKIFLHDSQGLVCIGRGDLNYEKKSMAKLTHRKCEQMSLEENLCGADVFIGVSKPGVVTRTMVKSMAKNAIVFAMANPVPEIMPDEAKKAGAKVVASGRSDFPNQINNVLAFPGVFRGVLDAGIPVINDEMKLAAAKTLASMVKNPTPHKIIPGVFDRDVAKRVAESVKRAYKNQSSKR